MFDQQRAPSWAVHFIPHDGGHNTRSVIRALPLLCADHASRANIARIERPHADARKPRRAVPQLSWRLAPHVDPCAKAAMTPAPATGICPADEGTELDGVAGAASSDTAQALGYSNFWDGSNMGNAPHSVA